jgi:hypothetical protein
MHTGEESDVPGPARPDRPDDERARGDRISVGANDDSVVRIQLAGRWAEAFAPPEGDSLASALKRFRTAFEYVDAVVHGVEPPSLDESGA